MLPRPHVEFPEFLVVLHVMTKSAHHGGIVSALRRAFKRADRMVVGDPTGLNTIESGGQSKATDNHTFLNEIRSKRFAEACLSASDFTRQAVKVLQQKLVGEAGSDPYFDAVREELKALSESTDRLRLLTCRFNAIPPKINPGFESDDSNGFAVF